MRAGHGHEHDFILVPFGIGQLRLIGMFAQAEKIAVGKHRALWVSSCSRCIELQHGIIWARRFERHPLCCRYFSTGFLRGYGILHMGQLPCQSRFRIVKAGPGEQQLCLRVVDNKGPFGRCQPPANGHHHYTHARRAVKQAEIQIAILANPGNPITLFKARIHQISNDLRRPFLQFGIAHPAVFFAHRHSARTLFSPMAYKAIKGQQIRNIAHAVVSPYHFHAVGRSPAGLCREIYCACQFRRP